MSNDGQTEYLHGASTVTTGTQVQVPMPGARSTHIISFFRNNHLDKRLYEKKQNLKEKQHIRKKKKYHEGSYT